jgi:hypothetical protein
MPEAKTSRVFLLSPANISGVRGRLILREEAKSSLALRLREAGESLGEIFSFISGLYFRGKLAYARAFAAPPAAVPGILIITASHGLVTPDSNMTLDDLRTMSKVPIDARESRYRVPLERDAGGLSQRIGDTCEVILLGSIATPKYVEPLLHIFGNRLSFPLEFVGRGDMSRGGLMLRSARENVQLTYAPLVESQRHGPKPARLPRVSTSSSHDRPRK